MRLILAAALLAASGCADGGPEAGSPQAGGPEADAPAAPSPTARAPLPDSETPYFVLGSNRLPPGVGPRPDSADPAARRAWAVGLFAAMRRDTEIKTRITATDDWRAADAVARRQVGPDSLVRHEMAVAMLNHHLLRGDLDADKADALGRYTDALLDHESREGAVILWALKRLDGHWDDARLRRAASLSADRLGAEYVRLARCVDCTIADAVDGLWPQVREATTDRLQEIADVHGELVRLADGD